MACSAVRPGLATFTFRGRGLAATDARHVFCAWFGARWEIFFSWIASRVVRRAGERAEEGVGEEDEPGVRLRRAREEERGGGGPRDEVDGAQARLPHDAAEAAVDERAGAAARDRRDEAERDRGGDGAGVRQRGAREEEDGSAEAGAHGHAHEQEEAQARRGRRGGRQVERRHALFFLSPQK